MVAKLAGTLQRATAEAVSSHSHTLTLTLSNGSFWHPDLERTGSAASAALFSALASATPLLDADDDDDAESAHGEEASGWNDALRRSGGDDWMRVRLLPNVSSAGSVSVSSLRRDNGGGRPSAGRPASCRPPNGCSTLAILVPQLIRYVATRDELLAFTLPPSLVWQDREAAPSTELPAIVERPERHWSGETQSSGETRPLESVAYSYSASSVVVEPPLRLLGRYPCVGQPSCSACTARTECGWCASDELCRALMGFEPVPHVPLEPYSTS